MDLAFGQMERSQCRCHTCLTCQNFDRSELLVMSKSQARRASTQAWALSFALAFRSEALVVSCFSSGWLDCLRAFILSEVLLRSCLSSLVTLTF